MQSSNSITLFCTAPPHHLLVPVKQYALVTKYGLVSSHLGSIRTNSCSGAGSTNIEGIQSCCLMRQWVYVLEHSFVSSRGEERIITHITRRTVRYIPFVTEHPSLVHFLFDVAKVFYKAARIYGGGHV